VGIVHVDDLVQGLLPIVEQQEAKEIAEDNTRLLNCWLGIATREDIGNTFCIGCEYLNRCQNLYLFFAGSRKMHPASLSRNILTRFGISSDYLNED
jgi:hypothetical protein